jgi:3,4-dihydroxy-2-butanone 4-phosphate synthase
VLGWDGHTEAGTDLSLLSGLSGVTALCEVVLPDWSMARLDDLAKLAEKENLPLISVGALVDYRFGSERMPSSQESSLHLADKGC